MTAKVTARMHPAASATQPIAAERDAVDRMAEDGDHRPAGLQCRDAGEDAEDDQREDHLRGGVARQQGHDHADRGEDAERRQALGLVAPLAFGQRRGEEHEDERQLAQVGGSEDAAHLTVTVRPHGPPSSSPDRARTYCQRRTRARVLPAVAGKLRRAGRRSRRGGAVASRACSNVQQGAHDMLAPWQTAASDGPAGSSSQRSSPSSSPRSSGARGRAARLGQRVRGSRLVVGGRREAIQQASGLDASPGLIAVVDTPGGAAGAARERVAAGRARPHGVPGVAVVRTPADGGRALVAADGTSALVTATLAASADEADVVARATPASSACRA